LSAGIFINDKTRSPWLRAGALERWNTPARLPEIANEPGAIASYATLSGVQAKLVEGRWLSRRPAPRGEKRPVDAARVIGYARFFPA
jgi:hypothetical protein